jgi:antitoxin component of MazEF toxin-antitoxin module
MKLQRQLSRIFKGKEYSKWIVVIPPDKIKELDWREGEELEAKVFHKVLILKSKRLRNKSQI